MTMSAGILQQLLEKRSIFRNRPFSAYVKFFEKLAFFIASYAHVQVPCVKSVQIRSFLWSVFSRIRTECGDLRKSLYFIRMRENTFQKKTPYLDTFHAVVYSDYEYIPYFWPAFHCVSVLLVIPLDAGRDVFRTQTNI